MHRTLSLIFSIMVNHIFLGAIVYAADTGVDAAKKEAAVVVYTGSSAADAAKLIAAFESKYPFVKVNLFRGNNERVLNKILTEGRTGSYLFDVATIDGLNGWVLKEHDYLQPHKSKETEAFPLEFQDPTGLLPCCMTVVTNMIGYNSKQVAKKDAPRTYQDLLDPKWKNNMGMDPDEAEWFRALISIWGKEKTIKYFTELGKQNTSTRRGHTLLSNLLAAGEFPVAVNIFGHRILELQTEGAPVELVHTDPVVVGPRHLLLSKRAPHPNAGRLFIDYTLSAEGQSLLASLSRTVVRPGIRLKQPSLMEGVKLYPIKPEMAKGYEEVSKLYYSIVK
jgi:iron(III) transport system substrate-binding protein